MRNLIYAEKRFLKHSQTRSFLTLSFPMKAARVRVGIFVSAVCVKGVCACVRGNPSTKENAWQEPMLHVDRSAALASYHTQRIC